MGFVSLLSAFFSLLDKLFGSYKEHQIESRGRDAERADAAAEVEERVEHAKEAVDNPDPVRLERLRNKYDRSREGEGN